MIFVGMGKNQVGFVEKVSASIGNGDSLNGVRLSWFLCL
jgi:hypothetical protein